MFRKAIAAAIVLGLVWAVSFSSPASAWVTPSAPTRVYDAGAGNAGDILQGAVPANWQAKPVLVFVQGLHGSANNWWGPTTYYGDNDMYAYAYNNGYRTFFVQFRDADGNAGSMWLNGSLLRQQLEWITKYAGVSKVNIVAHSKGGVDSQSAIVHYGAYPYVNRVLTLSSPHRGSELANLSYSWYAWWLGALLGQHDDGTYVMQTGYMDYFRSITDGRPEDIGMDRYNTLGGTHHGPWFSALWYGGTYLNAYGSNDGVVRTYSAHALPGHSADPTSSSWNHDNIRMGSQVFSYVNSFAGQLAAAESAGAGQLTADAGPARSYRVAALGDLEAAAASAEADQSVVQSGSIYRGGEFAQGRAVETVPVESGIQSVTFDVLTVAPGLNVAVVSPSGKRLTADQRSQADEYFQGAERVALTVDQPEAGPWTIEMNASGGTSAAAAANSSGAYLLTASLEGGVTASLSRPGLVAPGANLGLNIALNAGSGEVTSGSATGMLLRTASGKSRPVRITDARLDRFTRSRGVGGRLAAPGQEGVYNLSLTVTGTLADGSAFERSLVTSFAVARPEARDAAQLRAWVK